ncbi:hypothetical protein QWY87_05675 [Lutimonas halocynthiae]|uniref:hypothetical protein n=1 Tax=Lutimonas halocynthiae TaxID=1446477 RepID=UPI0025B5EC97|nr:hypothetical protein [Lutimonas halocynthiae]MDN3642179.1 hypothetical protein [Lutimonas halocynthiae]
MDLKKIALTILISVWVFNAYAQNELNPYKYIVVPKQFDFLKEENQYRVNSFTKFLFDKEGYQVFYSGDDYPEDLKSNPCLGLTANVLDESSAFTTKIFLVLENCGRDVVFKSVEGRSKIKDYNKTYIDALKKCFVSIQELDYVYEPYPLVKDTDDANTSETTEELAVIAIAATGVSEKDVVVEETVAAEPLANTEKSVSPESTSTAIPAAPVAVPLVIKEETKQADPEVEKTEAPVVARAFQNGTISFLLVNQGAQLQAYVSQSRNDKYRPGELIGTFEKSSLPNVYRVSWKKPDEGIDQTTAYFDDSGNLKIDLYRDGKLETLTFVEVK